MTGKLGKLLHFDIHAIERFRFELIGAMVLIIFTFVFYFGWRVNENETARLDGLINAAKAQISQIETEASTIEGLGQAVNDAGRNLALLEGRLKAINERLPSDRHIARLLSDLSDSGGDVKIVSIKPLQPEDKGELARLPFQISMESRFVSFGAYIERIENLPRLMVIDNITIEPREEGSNMLNSNLFLSAYVLGYGGGK
ncbi:MAG: type 4a pilus biogenesis protein PilO [Deltaproteobacteria bacterium]|nr:type 4a pilus biogenesis protein PilO [Deltaproteobacteria bacterium]